MEELVVVKQLPIIEQQLYRLRDAWEQRALEAEAMVCTPETVQAVKGYLADMRKEYQEVDALRKAVKKAILEPYEQFESTFKSCVTEPFKRAEVSLSGKAASVEADIKARCEAGLRDYFDELCAVHHLDWLTYERAGIRVDLTSAKAKTPKKIREQLMAFVAGIAESVDRINSLVDSGEIMVEFQRSLDAAGAICTVKERHRRIEEQKQMQEQREAIRAQEAEAVRKVEALATPVPVKVPPKQPEKDPNEIIPRCTFTAIGATRAQIWKLREFMDMEGIKYE